MTMGEFIALAAEDELHPKIQEKESKSMENMRTLAFQVPEDLFQRIKDYLRRNNMTQKQFVIGLIEDELERDEALLHSEGEEEAAGKDEPSENFSDEDSDVSADDFESDEDEDQSEEESEEEDQDYSPEM